LGPIAELALGGGGLGFGSTKPLERVES
jgi:hypothetical protein